MAADSVLPALPSYDFIAYGACITWSSQRRFTTGCVPSKVQSAVKAASTTRGGFLARGFHTLTNVTCRNVLSNVTLGQY